MDGVASSVPWRLRGYEARKSCSFGKLAILWRNGFETEVYGINARFSHG